MHECVRPVAQSYTQSGRDVKLRALCDWESYLGEKAQSSLCSLRISTMYHTQTTETAVVTWTHFYCNSSIESKKVLININTMPMFQLPPRTIPTPFFPPQEKKKREKEKHEKSDNSSLLIYRRRIFHFSTAAFSRLFLLFCVQDIRLWKIMHIRRIRTSTVGFSLSFLKLFPVKLIINDSIQLGWGGD